MSIKTIFIILISVLVTIILMNNTEEIDFWIFGDARVPKLTVLGCIFACGFIVGYLAGRPRRKIAAPDRDVSAGPPAPSANDNIIRHQLSDEDRDYIG